MASQGQLPQFDAATKVSFHLHLPSFSGLLNTTAIATAVTVC